jgi:proline iminopeptidase
MAAFFDPERFYLILHDQRGAGRSRPRAEWHDNTTQLLVGDIDRLRDHLGVEGQVMLWGGSWGTTLALAYAETHPEKVSGLVLRGVFLATKAEIDHFYHGGASLFFPDAFERLQKALPHPERHDYPQQLFDLAQSSDETIRQRAIDEWAYYEIRMSSVGMTDERSQEIVDTYDLTAFSVLENYYMSHSCFLEEGQLLRDAHRIAHIPTFIVNGRFDVVCPPRAAYQLASRLRNVEMELTAEAGHSFRERTNTAALLRGTRWVADQVESAADRASVSDSGL